MSDRRSKNSPLLARFARSSNPYRDELFPVFKRIKKLEDENTALRRLVLALLFALLVTSGAAGWYFAVLWKATK
jgi:hypothetical protein